MTKIILVSSSRPRSGKNTVARLLTEYSKEQGYTSQTLEFKDKLFEITADFLGISVEEFLDGYDLTLGDYYSDSVLEQLVGLTYAGRFSKDSWVKDFPMYPHKTGMMSKREALIHVSESIIKPHTSKDYFGHKLVEKIDFTKDFVFVPDSGFAEEAIPVIEAVGAENVLVVNLIRTVGENNIKDSRKMLTPEDFETKLRPQFMKVENNRTLCDLNFTLEETVMAWMDWEMINE